MDEGGSAEEPEDKVEEDSPPDYEPSTPGLGTIPDDELDIHHSGPQLTQAEVEAGMKTVSQIGE